MMEAKGEILRRFKESQQDFHRRDENIVAVMKLGLKIKINLVRLNGRQRKHDRMPIGRLSRNMGN